MTLDIEHSQDFAVIAPILSVLRDGLDEDLYLRRLSCALENGYRVMIAQSAKAVVGCLGYRITHDVFWGKTFYVDDLVVVPHDRSSGIGRALLEHAVTEARLENCDHVRLCSGLTRADAHRFYERNGFRQSSLQFVRALSKGAL